MENLTKTIKMLDLIEIQSILDSYQKMLEEIPAEDEMEDKFRIAQIERCDYLIRLIEDVLEDD